MKDLETRIEFMDSGDELYQKELLRQKSHDDIEDSIREKVRDVVLREAWARDAFTRIRQHQIDYLREAIKDVRDEQHIHDLTQKAIVKISEAVKSKIVDGQDLLSSVPRGSPALIVTNHFGAYKLLGINPKRDVGTDIPGYHSMYPYTMYFAALKPVAERMGNNLYYASNDFPGIFGDIHRKAGFIHVPPFAGNKTAFLIEQTREAITKRTNAAIVTFPEGTTSGKPSGRGPYDLEPFRTGAYAIAAELGIHVVPVVQYFHPQRGYELKVMQPFIPEKGDKEKYKSYAEQSRSEMQNWLDKCKASNL